MNIIVKIAYSIVKKKRELEQFFLMKRIRKGRLLKTKDQLKMFELPNAKEFVKMYIQKHKLSLLARIEIVKYPYAEEVTNIYAHMYMNCDNEELFRRLRRLNADLSLHDCLRECML